MPNKPLDTSLVDRAIIFAVKAHSGTERRGKGFPYIIHPMEAMEIVSTMTTDQQMLAAAALHDTVEDTDVTIEQIRDEFGERVASLVQSETDSPVVSADECASWRQRKQAALDTLGKAPLDAKIVAMGDKLSNMRIMARDYREIGDALWDRFHAPGGKKDHAWRYRALTAAFAPLAGTHAYREFISLVEELFGIGDPELLDMSQYEQSGDGFTAISYNSLEGRSMIKLYRDFIPRENAVVEMTTNWNLLKLGIKTPPALRLVTDGKSFGVEFLRVKGKRSFARAISQEPENLEHYARLYAREFKRLNSTPCHTGCFTNIADTFALKVNKCKYLKEEKKSEYLDFISSVPVETTCIHGDNHVGNILITQKEDIFWIDTADFAYGNHMFDMGMMYFSTYLISDELCFNLYHFHQADMVKVWETFVKEYFGPDSKLEDINGECAKFAALYIIRFGANGSPVEPEMIEFINNLKLI